MEQKITYFSRVSMAYGAEQHPSKPTGVRWVGEQCCRHGERAAPSLHMSQMTVVLCACGRNLHELSFPPSWEVVAHWDSKACQEGSPLLGMSSCAGHSTVWGLKGWYSTWRHNTATHSAPAQPSRQALTMICCCHPEQGQAALLGEWDGEEGSLAEWLAWLRQWAHGHERLLPRIWTRYSDTIPGVPLPLQPRGSHPCSPAALGTSGPQWSTLRHLNNTNRWQDFLTMEGLLHCIYFIAEETEQGDVKGFGQPLSDVPVQLLTLCPVFLNFGLNFQFYLKHMNPALAREFRLATPGHFLWEVYLTHLSDGQTQKSWFLLHWAL